MTTKQDALIFCVDGNVGSGKTVLVNLLKQGMKGVGGRYNIVYLQEPVEEWRRVKDANGITMLEKFYQNQEKYAFPFQMMAFVSRIAQLRRAAQQNPGAIIITERSVYTDRHVFAKMLYDDSKIEEVNYKVYLDWFDNFTVGLQLAGIIYLKTSPETCLTRIHKRARPGETISRAYSERCHAYHERWISESGRVLTLNGDREFEPQLPCDWERRIVEFIEQSKGFWCRNNSPIKGFVAMHNAAFC